MFKFLLPVAAVAAFTFAAPSTNSVEARGVHFRAGGLHIDVGNPHGHGRHYGHNHGYNHRYNQRAFYGGGYQHRAYYPSQRWHGAHSWHDTSHWDYHPREVYRHGNHYHVQPGHWDWHEDGHMHHHHD